MEIDYSGSQAFRVAYHRDFPAGFSISRSSPENFSAVHNYTRDFPPGCGPNASKPPQFSPQRPFQAGKYSDSSSDSSQWRRNVCAVKSNPPLSDKMVMKNPQKEMGCEPVMRVSSEKGLREREKVLGMLKLFRERCEEITRNEKHVKRVDLKANTDLKNEGKIISQPANLIGSVPGVEVGDKFYYRVELLIAGLHRLLQGGIDCIMTKSGSKLATCVVANESHFDKMNDPNSLTYMGEGGVLPRNVVGVPPDQELKGGNLALSNSMEEKQPVRVVRGVKIETYKIMYVYDGLYEVRGYEKKKGPQGNMIFEFQLTRQPGQPAVSWKAYRRY